MTKNTIIGLFVVPLMLLAGGALPLQAADYELGSPGIEMRRLQYCGKCNEPLVVTTIAPGVAVRCPSCTHVQRRLPNSELEIRVYQVCPGCGSRLDVSPLKPHDPLKCGSCGLAQRVLPEAIHIPGKDAGQGRIPEGPVVDPAVNIATNPPRVIRVPLVPGLNAPDTASAPGEGDAGRAADERAEPLPGDDETDNLQHDKGIGAPAPLRERGREQAQPLEAGLESALQSLRPAVWVNGRAIPESAVARALRRNYEVIKLNRYFADSSKSEQELVQEVYRQILDGLIDRELILQAAQRAGYVPGEQVVTLSVQNSAGQLSSERAREELMIDEMRRRYSGLGKQLNDVVLGEHYQKNIRKFSEPDRFQMRAIVIYSNREGRPDRRSAEDIAAEVGQKIGHGVDFTTLARRYSEGPFRDEQGEVRTASGGGLLGLDNLARPVQRRLESLAPGEVQGPLTMPGCLIFFRVEESLRGKPRDFKQIREEVARDYLESQRDRAFEDWVASLRRAALIEYPQGAPQKDE